MSKSTLAQQLGAKKTLSWGGANARFAKKGSALYISGLIRIYVPANLNLGSSREWDQRIAKNLHRAKGARLLRCSKKCRKKELLSKKKKPLKVDNLMEKRSFEKHWEIRKYLLLEDPLRWRKEEKGIL